MEAYTRDYFWRAAPREKDEFCHGWSTARNNSELLNKHSRHFSPLARPSPSLYLRPRDRRSNEARGARGVFWIFPRSSMMRLEELGKVTRRRRRHSKAFLHADALWRVRACILTRGQMLFRVSRLVWSNDYARPRARLRRYRRDRLTGPSATH